MSIALQPRTFSIIRYLNSVSWDNYLELFLGGIARTFGTIGIIMISCTECAKRGQRVKSVETIVQQRRRVVYITPTGERVRILGLGVNRDGSFHTVMDTLKK